MAETVHGRVVTLEVNEEENFAQVAFAEGNDGSGRYVIMQRTLQPDEQDIELGLRGCYLEVSCQSFSGYDLCEAIEWDGCQLRFRFRRDSKMTRDDLVLDLAGASYQEAELVLRCTLNGADSTFSLQPS
jgi:hypothetical protein